MSNPTEHTNYESDISTRSEMADGNITRSTATASVGTSDEARCDVSDGRSLRRVRNREHVISTVLELIRAGDANPSVQDIATHAGVSLRSVFRYFDDLDDLLRAAIEHGIQHALPLSDIDQAGEGPLELRIDTFVDSRLRLWAATHEFGRIARSRADSIPALARAIGMIYELLRTQAHAQFAPELSALDPVDAEFTLESITVMTGFGSFDTQRHVLGDGAERIRMVWKLNLHALLNAPVARHGDAGDDHVCPGAA